MAQRRADAKPVEEEVAPVEEEAAPVEEEVAPVEEEAIPVEEEAAPVEEEAAPVEEEAIPVKEEVAPVEEEADRGELQNRTLSIINNHPEGIRLVEIGEELDVAWQALTPLVRNLVESDKVVKIDNLYFPADA